MSPTTRRLTAKSRPFRVAQDDVVFFSIPQGLARKDLLAILRNHRQEPYFDNVCAAVALHRSADSYVLRRILETGKNSVQAQNTVATSGRTGFSLLKRLRRSRFQSVREHAEFALLARELKRASVRRMHEILDRYKGHAGIALGVQDLLARHPRSPPEILRRLERESDWDNVVEIAQRRLKNSEGDNREERLKSKPR